MNNGVWFCWLFFCRGRACRLCLHLRGCIRAGDPRPYSSFLFVFTMLLELYVVVADNPRQDVDLDVQICL